MDQRKIVPWVYGTLVVISAFVLGYFAGTSVSGPQIEITTALVETQPTEVFGESSVSAGTGVLVDLNTADQQTLQTLPGIGPVLAERILAYRQFIGRFVAKEQIMDVEGIGEVRYADLEQLITVEVEHENSGGG